MNSEEYQLSELEHQKIFEKKIQKKLFENAKSADKPVAIIFEGHL